jgi:23S rRNA (cytosine1962-C5)-methyltransferase
MQNYKSLKLKKGKEQSVKRYHPWIFSGAIEKSAQMPEEGDIVKVFSHDNQFLGIGHYQIGSIAVRLFSFDDCNIDFDFWKNKLFKAFLLRKELGLTDNNETNAFRLVNGEGDNMPGLIVDYYNGVAVMQMHSIGMYKCADIFTSILKDLFGNNLIAVYNKSSATLPYKADINHSDGYLFGNIDRDIIISENSNHFKVNWLEGQKTGFFLDQRNNRQLLQKFSENKTVLNMFGYTGGFSVYALKGGAKLVHTVDSSEKAIDLSVQNIELNFGNTDKHKAFAVDAWEFLKNAENEYDFIILDPPAFAKHNNVIDNAIKGYKRLNTIALRNIKSNGILFTFSCSQVISKEIFKQTIFVASANAKRNVRILYELSQPPDHPVNIFHPEGEYLKGLVLFVE